MKSQSLCLIRMALLPAKVVTYIESFAILCLTTLPGSYVANRDK